MAHAYESVAPPTARIGANVHIGEYVVVRDNAVVGAGTRLCDHAIVAEQRITEFGVAIFLAEIETERVFRVVRGA